MKITKIAVQMMNVFLTVSGFSCNLNLNDTVMIIIKNGRKNAGNTLSFNSIDAIKKIISTIAIANQANVDKSIILISIGCSFQLANNSDFFVSGTSVLLI